jgi:hypothetical protein
MAGAAQQRDVGWIEGKATIRMLDPMIPEDPAADPQACLAPAPAGVDEGAEEGSPLRGLVDRIGLFDRRRDALRKTAPTHWTGICASRPSSLAADDHDQFGAVNRARHAPDWCHSGVNNARMPPNDISALS